MVTTDAPPVPITAKVSENDLGMTPFEFKALTKVFPECVQFAFANTNIISRASVC
jgi:hypothetical protein